MPGNPRFPLPEGTLAPGTPVAALTNTARVLCDPAHPQSSPSAFILWCDHGMPEELVLFPCSATSRTPVLEYVFFSLSTTGVLVYSQQS